MSIDSLHDRWTSLKGVLFMLNELKDVYTINCSDILSWISKTRNLSKFQIPSGVLTGTLVGAPRVRNQSMYPWSYIIAKGYHCGVFIIA